MGIALLVALLALPASAGLSVGRPVGPAAAGPTAAISSNYYRWWCSSERTPAPTFNLSSLGGSWSGTTRAHACPGSHGRGASDDSYAYTQGEIAVRWPVHLTATNHGVSVGWNLDLKGSTNTSYGAPVGGCPWIDTNSTFTNASTTLYYSFQYQWCDVEAVVAVTANASLLDLTTGQVIQPANHWSGFYLDSGKQIINYRWVGSYSNRSYWSRNYSLLQSDNWTFTNQTRSSVQLQPSWFLNGTFRATDRYEVVVYLNNSMAAESFLYFGGRAVATFDGAQGRHHEDLVPPLVY